MCAAAASHLTFTVIYDNRKGENPSLKPGFGFSCLIETPSSTILFDTGGDRDAFFGNCHHLGIDLARVTHVVFSHKHWDHTAGFKEVLGKLHPKAIVYLPSPFPNSFLKQVPATMQLKSIADYAEIDKDVHSLVLKGGWWGMTIHEQSLVFDTDKGLVILTGCAHPGIINIIQASQARLRKSQVNLVMGGFHLAHSCCTQRIVQKFQQLKVQKVAPCHCAGDKAMAQFKDAYEDNYLKVATGTVLKI